MVGPTFNLSCTSEKSSYVLTLTIIIRLSFTSSLVGFQCAWVLVFRATEVTGNKSLIDLSVSNFLPSENKKKKE